jgi:DNA-binding NtrC family response regulator
MATREKSSSPSEEKKEMSQGLFPEFPLLLVDDEEPVLSSESKVLRTAGINNLIPCQDSRDVMPLLAERPVELIVLDIAMPHLSGDVLLGNIREAYPEVPVIIVTASDDIDTAVLCMKTGAFDYMVKAVEPSRLVSGVRRAIELRQLSRRYSTLRESLLADKLSHPDAFESIVTRNRRMQAIFAFSESIAESDETVLITGETGSGKELIAEVIHRLSGRSGALVKVNAAGLDDTMFADTLFGHTKGAYTGADEVRKGLVQQAGNGTLFLDEIGDLSVASQVKLLRLIETREYYPLGSDLVRSIDARFVLATNRNLVDFVEEGRFRKDLYFRLKTHEIKIPPLRQRRDDLPLLLNYFLDEAAQKLSKKRLSVPGELLTLLETYDFPGNIRELRSMVFNAVSRQKDKMLSMQPFREAMGRDGEDAVVPSSGQGLTFPERLPSLKEATGLLIEEALSRARGNQAIAAGLLGITPQALSKRLSRKRQTEPGS